MAIHLVCQICKDRRNLDNFCWTWYHPRAVAVVGAAVLEEAAAVIAATIVGRKTGKHKVLLNLYKFVKSSIIIRCLQWPRNFKDNTNTDKHETKSHQLGTIWIVIALMIIMVVINGWLSTIVQFVSSDNNNNDGTERPRPRVEWNFVNTICIFVIRSRDGDQKLCFWLRVNQFWVD